MDIDNGKFVNITEEYVVYEKLYKKELESYPLEHFNNLREGSDHLQKKIDFYEKKNTFWLGTIIVPYDVNHPSLT